MKYYLKDKQKVYIRARGKQFLYPAALVKVKTYMGTEHDYYIDLAFTAVDENGMRKLPDEFYTICLNKISVEEVLVKKEILRDEEGEHFLSNNLKTGPIGKLYCPVIASINYKIRLFKAEKKAAPGKRKTAQSKKLKGIKPFNKFLFRSCYYHQLIAAFARYGVDERLILMNYFPLYDKENMQTYSGLSIFTDEEIEKLSGMRLVKKKNVTNVVNEIITSIDRGMPVMILIDTYYVPYREDTYKKQHLPHFVLIYGYDRPKKIFIINEHMFVNSYFYAENEIGFGVIRRAHENYKKRLDKGQDYGFIKIRRKEKRQFSFELSHYIKAYRDNCERISESISNLLEYCERVKALLLDKSKLDDEIAKLYTDFAYIRLKKNIQRYQAELLFNDAGLNEINSRCADNMGFIYGLLVKIKLADAYSPKSVEKLTARLDEVIAAERKIELWMEEAL